MSSFSNIQERLAALEPIIKKICAVAGTPGVTLSVVNLGEVVHRAAYGLAEVETNSPVSHGTIFAIGTMAKAFTASAVGILVSEGKLQWTTPIRRCLPAFKSLSDTVTENLTVVDLLTHRSGLARSNFWWQGAEGELLLEKSALLEFFNNMEPTGDFRADWAYNNYGYAILGEIIETLTGMSFGQYLEEKLLRPLGMTNTSFGKLPSQNPNLARPYAAMDDASLHRLPLPPVHNETIMAPALGGWSTSEDLMKYTVALLRAHQYEVDGAQDEENKPAVIRHALMQLSGHIFTATSILEKSYAFGFYRTQLPNTVLGMGWNSIYVKKMPTLVPKSHVGPVIAHGGSLPGYHVAMALLPMINSGVVVCTNSIALGDVSGWVAQAILEVLIESPHPTDFVALAAEAARSNATSVSRFSATLNQKRVSTAAPSRPLRGYIGRYSHPSREGWFLDIRMGADDDELEVAFKGLNSQAWKLRWYENDTFLWLASREEQTKRGRMTTYPLVANHFKIIFRPNHAGQIDSLCWPHEAGLSEDKQLFVRGV